GEGRSTLRLTGLMVGLALCVLAAACSPSGAQQGAGQRGAGHQGAGETAAGDRAVASPGCRNGHATAAVTEQRQDLEVDGAQRWYLITHRASPAGGAPRPLVLDFHGLAEGARIQAVTSQWGALADKNGFIVAFPNGTGSPVQWDTNPNANPNTDLDYVGRLIDNVESGLCVDESRVYASGGSLGAFMVSALACAMAGRVAAVAGVSGVQLPKQCKANQRVPILAFHGTADPILYFNGGIGTGVLNHALGGGPAPATSSIPPADLHGAGYPATIQGWAAREGCDPHSTDTKISPHVIHRTYRCPSGTAVELYIVLGGGHAWPGSRFSNAIAQITGPTTFEINA
ncbi:MAG: alpha/beta hydrolase family esterase, partial [Acidimicrobiales bacterium]